MATVSRDRRTERQREKVMQSRDGERDEAVKEGRRVLIETDG